MNAASICRALDRFGLKSRRVYGCEERGDGGDLYLTRYFLLGREGSRLGRLYLHVFHRSDYDRVLHDHPWPFVSLILSGGYVEHTRMGALVKVPGMVLFRRANHAHRVELLGSYAVTLVWTGPKVREWGFWTARGWQHFADYFREHGC